MARRNYGALSGGGGGRRGGGAWQWMVIGVVLGRACSITVGLAGVAVGLVSLDIEGLPGRPTSTPVVMVITATPLPATPTPLATDTPEPTETQPVQVEITAPSPTPLPPTPDPSIAEETQPTASPTTFIPASNTAGDASIQSLGSEDEVPQVLAALASTLVSVHGGTFTMETTPAEVLTAVTA